MEKYIYYSGQRNWTYKDYDYLNSFLNKIFLYRDNPDNNERIETMNLGAMEYKTKAILKAVLMSQGIFDEMMEQFPNLRSLKDVTRLNEPLFLSKNPCNLFKEYKEMNIII